MAESATTGAPPKKKTTEKADMTPRKDTQRGQGAGGGGNRGPSRAQRSTLSHTEKRHADDPHRAVPAAPPDHQGTDGGAAGGGGQWGSPPEGASGEAAQVGLQVGGQGRGPEACESARETTMARGRPAEGTRSRRTTVRGRAGDRGEGRVERRERRLTASMAKMSGTRGSGAHLAWPGTAKGCATGRRWDRTRAPNGAETDGCAVLLCVHAGRREPHGRKHGKNKHEQNPTAAQEGVRHKAGGRRENGTEQKGRRGTAGEKKIIAMKNSTNNDG